MRRQRRQNTRLNLGRDPLGAGVAYSQSGFNDLGGLLSQKIQQGTAKVAAFEKQRRDQLKLEEEKAGLMVEGFMSNLAEGVDLTAIPDEDKGMITDFSMNQKQIYADAAQAAGSMKAGSPEKLEQIAIMKQANQRLQNVEKQYNAWGGMREDYIQDFQNKNLSVANSSGNMISAASIFTGAQQRSFDENGNIIFTDAQGNTTRMSDIKQPFEKAWKQGDQINESMMALYNSGEKLDDTTRPYLRNKFSRLIDNAGVEGLQSLAFDKMVGNESFFSEEEKEFIESLDTNDPEALVAAKKQFKEQLLDRMMNVADQQANNGFNKQQTEIDKQEREKDKDKIDINSMVVRDKFEAGDIILPNENPNDLNSNQVHSLQEGRTVDYNTAAVLTDRNYRVTPIEKEVDGEPDPAYKKGQYGVFVTDPSGRTVAGPFYNEEDLSSFLELKQSQN